MLQSSKNRRVVGTEQRKSPNSGATINTSAASTSSPALKTRKPATPKFSNSPDADGIIYACTIYLYDVVVRLKIIWIIGLLSKLNVIEMESAFEIACTALRQSIALRKKLQVEADREAAGHECELLELWQTMVDAEEEAAVLEAKELVAGKIIEIHEHLLSLDSLMREMRDALLPASMAVESIMFAEIHKDTSITFLGDASDCSYRSEELLSSVKVININFLFYSNVFIVCTYINTVPSLPYFFTQTLRELCIQMSKQPLLSIAALENITEFLQSTSSAVVTIEENITKIERAVSSSKDVNPGCDE